MAAPPATSGTTALRAVDFADEPFDLGDEPFDPEVDFDPAVVFDRLDFGAFALRGFAVFDLALLALVAFDFGALDAVDLDAFFALGFVFVCAMCCRSSAWLIALTR